MTNERGESAFLQPSLEVVGIEPGQRISVVTQNGSLYEVSDIREIEGMIHTTVMRRPATQDGKGTQSRTIDDAFIISWPNDNPHSLRQIYQGSRLEVIGYDRATNERVDFRTSPVVHISSELSAD